MVYDIIGNDIIGHYGIGHYARHYTEVVETLYSP
jgi:hypothetical protein